MDDLRDVMEQENVEHIIQVVLKCRRVHFCGQKKGIDKGNVVINVDNLQQFKESLFQQIFETGFEFYLRGVSIVTEGEKIICSWSDVIPTVTTIGDWIMFNVPTSHRVNFSLAEVTENVVIGWKNKIVNLYVTAYSNIVNSATVFASLKKQLIDPPVANRGGADDNVSVHQLAERLRLTHPTYQSTYITYYSWAAHILSKPAHMHQRMINDVPPAHLILNFNLIRMEDPRIEMMRQSFSATTHMMANLKEQSAHIRAMDNDMNRRLELLENTIANYEGILVQLVGATAPVDNPAAQAALEAMENRQDEEHL